MITLSTAGIYALIATGVTAALIASDYRTFNNARPTQKPSDPYANIIAAPEEEALPSPTPDNEETIIKPPARTTFLIIALDKDRVLTDALMAGCFYRDSCEVRLMSIPRDFYTRLSDEMLSRIRDDGRKPPTVMKINALRSYGGAAYGTQYLLDQLGDMLGVRFQYYVEVDIPAFKKIVDALGGVYMDVPNITNGGLYYDDPEQNLHIAIPAGYQKIDGDMAEGLVRFRSYRTGDVGRNAVQMEFLKQLIRQALNREAIMNDPMKIIETIMTDVRTNIGMDLIKYTPYATQLSGDKINTYTMPGEGSYVGDVSYFFPDEKKLPDAINEVFYAQISESTNDVENTQPVEMHPSAGLRIQVLNGSRVAGLASSYADMLKNDGYNVVSTDVYTGTMQNTTRILVRDENTGEDLLTYFKKAEIKTDTSISNNYDIVIIIGQNEG